MGVERGLELRTVGLGSNLLAADDGIDSLVLRLAGDLAGVETDGEVLRAGEARRTPSACIAPARRGSAASSSPARSLAPPVAVSRMNAGAYGLDWSAMLERALVVSADGSGWLTQDELGLEYRRSLVRPEQVVARVEYHLARRPVEEIKADVADLVARRKATQPTNKRTFGSVFKNPPGELGAGRMLELCGLKGYAVGGAVVSPRHANFVENAGGATSEDCLSLMREARRRAHEQFGVELEHEVVLLGSLAL